MSFKSPLRAFPGFRASRDAAMGRTVQLGYSERVLATQSANLIAYWPMWETAGVTADNLEGTAARDGTYTGVSLNNSTFSNGDPVGLWDGANDYCNIQTASLAAALNGLEGTLMLWLKVVNAGVWTDSAAHYGMYLQFVNVNNKVEIYKNVLNNTFTVRYRANGTYTDKHLTISTTDWFQIVITWSDTADELIVYLNGAAQGAAQSIGTMVGALTIGLIGSTIAAPTNVWNGWIAHTAFWTTPLSPAQIATLAVV